MRKPSLSRGEFIKLMGAASLSLAGASLLKRARGSRLAETVASPNLLVLVFDAFSALDMSLYGYPRQTTPNFERFANRATVYHRHYSAGNFTTPGTASLLTGVMPWTHRALHLQGETLETFADRNIFSLLPAHYHRFAYTHNSLVYILLDQFRAHVDELLKISDLAAYSDLLTDKLPLGEFHTPLEAELLALKGSYQSSLFLSLLDEAQRTAKTNALNEAYRKEFPRGLPNCRPGDSINATCFTLETAGDWLVKQMQNRPRPFFGYVHLFPPHAPYNPSREFIGQFNDNLDASAKPAHHFAQGKTHKALVRLRRQYDETIAYVDREFGRIVEALDEANAFENTLFVVTSDHGEINERGISGHNTPVLYEPLTHVPLLISYPGQVERRDIHQLTHATDLVPTLLQAAGAVPPAHLEGAILPRDDQSIAPARDLFVVEAKSSPKTGRMNPATFALIHDRYRMIYYRGYADFDEKYELYDLQEDPEERQDLAPSQDRLFKDLKVILSQKIKDYI